MARHSGWPTQWVRNLVLTPHAPHFQDGTHPFCLLRFLQKPSEKIPGIPGYSLSHVCPLNPLIQLRSKTECPLRGSETQDHRKGSVWSWNLKGEPPLIPGQGQLARCSPSLLRGTSLGMCFSLGQGVLSERVKSRLDLFSRVALCHAIPYRCSGTPVSGGWAGAGRGSPEKHLWLVSRNLTLMTLVSKMIESDRLFRNERG